MVVDDVHALANLLSIDLSGFGRPPGPVEIVDRAAKAGTERLMAIESELASVSDEHEQLMVRARRLRERISSLQEQRAVVNSVVATLIRRDEGAQEARQQLGELLGQAFGENSDGEH